MPSTSALEYQDNVNVQFTFNPTLSLSLSGDLSIEGLNPGGSSDSNIIDVNVSTNNVSGYNLTATVGDNNNPTTNLSHLVSASDHHFTNLTSPIPSLSDFSPNTWGYSYSNNNGVTWVSDISGTLGYAGLPLYTSASSAIISEKYNPSEDTIQFKIGASTSTTQLAGAYTNTINFTATAYPSPITFADAFASAGKQPTASGYYKMQDMTSTICNAVEQDQVITLIDIRDDTPYLVGKAKDNRCWMIQNLRLGQKTETLGLIQEDSNVGKEGFILKGKSTDGIFHAYTVDGINGQNNNAEYYCTAAYGCYYNWYTATAGSGTTWVYTGDVDYSICPAGWSLPNTLQFTTLYNQYGSPSAMLVDNPATTRENTMGKIPGFLLSGRYNNDGAIKLGDNGPYWSSTAYEAQFGLSHLFSTSMVNPSYGSKYIGFSVRCLAK